MYLISAVEGLSIFYYNRTVSWIVLFWENVVLKHTNEL
jgi:hypothetical protein